MATSFARRTAGAALASYSLRSDRTIDPATRTVARGGSENIVEFEASEDGAVRLFLGRFSAAVGERSNGVVQYVFDLAAVTYVRRLLGIISEISAVTGYLGGWTLGVGATGLRGLSSYDDRSGYSPIQLFEEDDYIRVTQASYADLRSQAGTLTDRLLGRFLRKLGTHPRYTTQLSNPPAPDSVDVEM